MSNSIRSPQVTFKMKIPERSASEGIAFIYVGSQDANWNQIAGLGINTVDFAATDTYQEFTIAFDVTEVVNNGEIRLDYLGQSTALIVDTVEVKNLDSAVPVFALIRLDWNEDVRQSLGQFGKEFEAGGGVYLTVEEFMASLNPAFMIEFAEPIVGSDHPLLIQAKEQFAHGQYFESLISVRLALKGMQN